MNRDEFCNSIKEQYPVISAKADEEYTQRWGDDLEYYSHIWFEALADRLNVEMNKGSSAQEYRKLFCSISSFFSSGDEEIKKCIDVAFVENLFWQVPAKKVKDYWEIMPENLKMLYLNFHHRPPL